ncbi:hypothetical protein GCM10022267_56230 [Lentzea roselyniae]|uniref:Uncharacterized protein n=1 Tax=Lentzea roselyniae TaxID=531940 RepID=A0ABP7BJN5_9PSEU
MPRWKNLVNALTRPRQGFSADGRTLGLGLATALNEQRKDAEAVAAVAKTLRPSSQGKDAEGHTIHG